jgi:HEAT repeat protein
LRKKLLLSALIVLILLLVVGAYLIKFSDEELKSPVAFSNYEFITPMTVAYDVKYESSGEMNLSNMMGGEASEFNISIAGRLSFNLLRRVDKDNEIFYEIFLKMSNVSGNFNISDEDMPTGMLGELAGRVILDSYGKIVYFKRAENSLKLSGNILKSFLSVWAVVLPKSADYNFPMSWRKSENSFFGKVDSLYVLKKAKQDIEDGFDMLGMPCSPELKGESGTFILVNRTFKENPTGNIDIVLGLYPVLSLALKAEISKQESIGRDIGGKYRANMEMTLVSRGEYNGSAEMAKIPFEKYQESALLTDDTISEDVERQFLEKIVGNLTLEEIGVMVADLEARRADQRQITAFYLKIKAYVSMNVDDLSELHELLLEAKEGSLLMELLSSALSSSGKEEALDVLLEIVKKRSGESSLIQKLIPLLVLGGVITPKAQEYLIKLARKDKRDEIRTTTDLALGIAARSLDDYDTARSKRLVSRAIKNFKKAHSDDEKRLRLQELGNTGSTDILRPIKPMLDSEDSDVRADAVFQLRFVKGPEAEDILIGFIGDSSNEVRKSVTKTFSFRKPSQKAINAFMDAFSKEEDDSVRYMIVKSIWHGRHENPKVRTFMEEVSANDSAERVRILAKSLL